MQLKLLILIALAGVLTVHARQPHLRNVKVRSKEEQVENPMKAIIRLLEGQKKKDFIELAKSNRELKKSEAKKKIDEFVEKLSTELKDKIKKATKKIDEQIEARDKKVEKLGKEAKELYEKINKVIKDESITKKEELTKVQELINAANKDVLKEFKTAGVQLPDAPEEKNDDKDKDDDKSKDDDKDKDDKKDKKKKKKRSTMHRGPGGYIGSIYYRLTPKQKAEINKVLMQRNKLIKKDMRDKINAFVGKLANELQKKFKAAKEEHAKQRAKDREAVKGMSPEAQKLYEDVMKIDKDGSITFRQEEVKIHEIVKKADKKVIDEFRDKEVSIPTLPLKKPDSKPGDDKKDDDKKDDDKKSSEDAKDDKKDTSTESKDDKKSDESSAKKEASKKAKSKAKRSKTKRSRRSRSNRHRPMNKTH